MSFSAQRLAEIEDNARVKGSRFYTFELIGSQRVRLVHHGEELCQLEVGSSGADIEKVVDYALAELKAHLLNLK